MNKGNLQSSLETAQFKTTTSGMFKAPAGKMFAYSNGTPTASTAGYSPGCINIDYANGYIYKNTGSVTSSTWTSISTADASTVDTITPASGTLTVTASGTIELVGATNVTGALAVSTTTTSTGDLTVGSSKAVVTASSGTITTAGYFISTATAAANAIAIPANGSKFAVVASTGAVTAAGLITGAGIAYGSGTITGTGDVSISSGLFAITGATGAAKMLSITGLDGSNLAIAASATTNQAVTIDGGGSGAVSLNTTGTGGVNIGLSGGAIIAGKQAAPSTITMYATTATISGSTAIALTGNTTITGTCHITGAVTFDAGWTMGSTLVMGTSADIQMNGNKLTLDTDDNSYIYASADNRMDIYLSSSSEYAFSTTSLDMSGNHLDNAGYVIFNEITLPAETECYAGRDNTGDLTLNALNGKQINFAINGVDIVNVLAAGLDFDAAATISTQATTLTLSPSTDVVVANGKGLIVGNTAQVTAISLGELQVLGTSAADSTVIIGQWAAAATGGALNFAKSRNATIGTATIVADNDVLGTINFCADDGVNFDTVSAAIEAEVDDATAAANSIGGALVFKTAIGTGADDIGERLRINAAGDTCVANGYGLIVGNATGVTVSSLGEFQVLGTAAADSTVVIGHWAAAATGGELAFAKSRNAAIGSFTIVQDNDVVGSIVGYADDGTTVDSPIASVVFAVDDGTPAENQTGGSITFSTTAVNANTVTEVFRVDSTQNVRVAAGNGVIIGLAEGTAPITVGYAGELQVLGAGGAGASSVNIGAFSADASGTLLSFVKSRHATVGSNTTVADNDVIGAIQFHSADGSDFATVSAAIRAEVDDAAIAASQIGGALVFYTALGSGNDDIAEKLRINAAGNTVVANGYGLHVGNEAGLATPVEAELQLLGTAAADSAFNIAQFSAAATAGSINFIKGRNAAIGTPTIVNDDDNLGTINFCSDDGVDFATVSAKIEANVDDATAAANSVGGELIFYTAIGTGADDITERMRINAAGTTTFSGPLTVGVADTDYDVIFYGETAASYFKWDGANDNLLLQNSGLVFASAAGGDPATLITCMDAATNFVKFNADGDGGATLGATMTKSPEAVAEDGFITILVGATSYQIPFYAA